jgi:hypothetical protein
MVCRNFGEIDESKRMLCDPAPSRTEKNGTFYQEKAALRPNQQSVAALEPSDVMPMPLRCPTPPTALTTFTVSIHKCFPIEARASVQRKSVVQ